MPNQKILKGFITTKTWDVTLLWTKDSRLGTILFAKPCWPWVLFSNPFPMKCLDIKSKKSRFGLNLSNPSSEWVQWIWNPFLDLPKGTENPLLDLKSGIRFWPKACTQRECTRNCKGYKAHCFCCLFCCLLLGYRANGGRHYQTLPGSNFYSQGLTHHRSFPRLFFHS